MCLTLDFPARRPLLLEPFLFSNHFANPEGRLLGFVEGLPWLSSIDALVPELIVRIELVAVFMLQVFGRRGRGSRSGFRRCHSQPSSPPEHSKIKNVQTKKPAGKSPGQSRGRQSRPQRSPSKAYRNDSAARRDRPCPRLKLRLFATCPTRPFLP
jgi:hypothetical protein